MIKCKVCGEEMIYGDRCIECFLAKNIIPSNAVPTGFGKVGPHISGDPKFGFPDYCMNILVEYKRDDISFLGNSTPISIRRWKEVSLVVPSNDWLKFLDFCFKNKYTITETRCNYNNNLTYEARLTIYDY